MQMMFDEVTQIRPFRLLDNGFTVFIGNTIDRIDQDRLSIALQHTNRVWCPILERTLTQMKQLMNTRYPVFHSFYKIRATKAGHGLKKAEWSTLNPLLHAISVSDNSSFLNRAIQGENSAREQLECN